MEKSIKVWDWPTRLFHWSLVVLFGGMWFTGEQGGNWLQYHIWSGEAIAVLLLFRLIWGVIGSETARFSQFVKGPAAIRAYLQGKWTPRPGHNPLGALMVLALLAVLLVQVGSGLFATDVDSYTFDGPLARLISGELSESVTRFHKLLFNLILLLVGLHITAIVAYRVIKKQNLVRAMLTGYQVADGQTPAPYFRAWQLALLSLLLSGGGVYLLLTRL
ncbi:cytochrome b/b6 domain-containing protein [Aquitalea sp. ASV11]|uniref:cytochrome b/b6 domain-containing protein n=1 Tax=Aquitalea sp. ASV11 TaxID=2795103 RepID=UPI0018EA8F0A|nr:cytochrome b/b6 domain-containing protein [Aquitalea sp. ASV11]